MPPRGVEGQRADKIEQKKNNKKQWSLFLVGNALKVWGWGKFLSLLWLRSNKIYKTKHVTTDQYSFIYQNYHRCSYEWKILVERFNHVMPQILKVILIFVGCRTTQEEIDNLCTRCLKKFTLFWTLILISRWILPHTISNTCRFYLIPHWTTLVNWKQSSAVFLRNLIFSHSVSLWKDLLS